MPKRKRGDKEDEAPPLVKLDSDFPPGLKRRCLGEPDVTVVVGGTSFQHHRFMLCYSSEYFDTMLSSGMQESENKRIEFPDKNPEHWKLFYPFLEPRSLSTANTVCITKDNAKAILPWFHEFDMADLLKESDEKLWSSLLLFKHGYYPSDHRTLAERKATLLEIMDWAAVSNMYGLQKTRDAMMKELKRALSEYPELVNKELLCGMYPYWSKAADVDLWNAVKSKLPPEVIGKNTDDDLRSNPLFLDLLAQSFQVAALTKTQRRVSGDSMRGDEEEILLSGEDLARLRRRYRAPPPPPPPPNGPDNMRDVRHRINAAREEFDDLRRHHGLAYRRLMRRRQAVNAERHAMVAARRDIAGANGDPRPIADADGVRWGAAAVDNGWGAHVVVRGGAAAVDNGWGAHAVARGRWGDRPDLENHDVPVPPLGALPREEEEPQPANVGQGPPPPLV